jgi:scyllo-inositol 2-dehydrogenase (NADP+)
MPQPINVVSVGAGWVTANRHIPALMGDRRARVVGIVDPNADRAQALAERYKLPHWGTSLDEPWMADVACAAVGTPPARHAEIAIALLERGIHVLCEKPMATTVADAEAMVACAERHQRVLGVVHNFQFATAMCRARTLLEQGALGELTAVYAFQLSNPLRRLPSWYPSLPGGLFYDEAPHLLYLLRSLIGELRLDHLSCRVDRSPRRSPGSLSPLQVQQIDARFDHPTVWAQLTMNFDSPLSEWQFILVGTRQLIAVDIFRDISILLPNDGSHSAGQILRTTWRGVGEHLVGVARSGIGFLSRRMLYGNETVVRRFLDAVTGDQPPLGISGSDGLAVVNSIHDILRRATGEQIEDSRCVSSLSI